MIIHEGVTRFPTYATISFFFILVIFSTKSTCWNLASVNLPGDAFIWKFAIWRNRAFLAIPRWNVGDNGAENTSATLYETAWPENGRTSTTNGSLSPFLHKQSANDDCSRSATGLEVDVKGRLWLLEVPDEFSCSARIVVYDLKRNNQLVASVELTNIPTKDLRALVVDQWGFRAYVGDSGDETILTFNLEMRKWWKVQLARGQEAPRVCSSDLAISRRNSVLYMTGQNVRDLFSINLEELRSNEGASLFSDKAQNITVSWHGTKMGISCGLFSDVKGGLHYFMTSERASVRWDTRLPLKAESHSILLQSEDYPCITDYKTDAQKNVWGLVNSHCPFARKEPVEGSPLKSRTVKIGKYPAP